MGTKEMVELEGYIKAQTDKAILFDYEDVEDWIPKSQLESSDALVEETLISITIPEWLAKEKGFM